MRSEFNEKCSHKRQKRRRGHVREDHAKMETEIAVMQPEILGLSPEGRRDKEWILS